MSGLQTILAALGKNAVTKSVDNPFAFFRVYNQAAARRGEAPRFSKDAMAFLQALEKRYQRD